MDREVLRVDKEYNEGMNEFYEWETSKWTSNIVMQWTLPWLLNSSSQVYQVCNVLSAF